VCGICGIMNDDPDRTMNLERLERMSTALAHRGPDDAGLWHEPGAGLAHRRLSILDTTSAGHQPMISADGNLVMVFNGEIYNFQELRKELEGRGASFHTQCDTEVLLEAHRVWGDDAVHRLNGMFAYACYDRRRHRLLLVRDRLGIKPLFYTRQNGALAFASELDALVQGGFAEQGLNPGAIDAYFTYLYIPAPDTIYKNVFKLLPGERLILEQGRITHEHYWRLELKEDAAWTLDSAAEAFLALFKDAVRLQRISDVPLGAFLSGGMDSSAVVAVLSRYAEQPVKTFTIGFEDAHRDETRFARIAATHFGTDHTEEILRPDMVETAERFARHFGEPFADSSALPMWLVSKIARRSVTVALSGDGGDELFGGYAWMHRNRQVARFRKIPALARRGARAVLSALPESPSVNQVRRFAWDTFLTADESFRRRLTCFTLEMRQGLFSPEFARELQKHTVDRYAEHCAEARTLSDDDRMLFLDTAMYLPDDILTKVDRMSMAHGLEARVPLLDHRLVEFAATLPFPLKYARGVSKRVMKHALRETLPPELLAQRKQGFAIPIHRWFREDLQDHFRELALENGRRCGQFLSPAYIRRLFNQHLSGNENHGHPLWAILVFELWLRHVETKPALRV